ncbi:MAG: 30S ribosomal protein S12 methylthiotransferase RimO [Firmicutes bacterium]|nr:30S ribosomal protein S12 methylthiotransferase RimO [Bacillota bacterium]
MEKQNTKRVAIVSLGCDKNRVDTERMLYRLRQGGYEITSEFDKAEIIVVNTCAFILSARREAVGNILQCAEYKNPSKGICQKLIVTGCLPQKHIKDGIAKDLPEVDAFLGVGAYDDICNILDDLYQGKKVINIECAPQQEREGEIDRFITTPMHYAYLKIAEGCDSRCTFCTIPSIRGKFVSKPMTRVIEETKSLVDKGAKEIILVAQDVTNYGADIGTHLVALLDKMTQVEGVEWVRLMYCYPDLVSDDLIQMVAQNPKIANYMDIPLQHISDNILRLMARRNNQAQTRTLLEKIRQASPDIAIRSTFMTGFPGETESDHQELLDFLQTARLDNVGFFAYSKEEGTPSYHLPNQVSAKVKKERLKQLYATQQQVSHAKQQAMIGKTIPVLYEDIDYQRSLFVGRTQGQAPDIDPVVKFKGNNVDVGQFYKIKITGTQGIDLLGELV